MNEDSTSDSHETVRPGPPPIDPTLIPESSGSMAFLSRSTPGVDPPERVGPFRILEAIGAGGMGDVYLAEQNEPVHRRVALKLIRAGRDTREVIARFESERQALALMSHTNIASVYEAGATDEGRPYFVMEYVPGVPITAHCDEHRLDTEARLELLLKVCDGIHHAHQKGIIHRDLKPTNVLVMVEDGRPVPKVIDFGLAKATDQTLTERTLSTEVGQIMGTPEFMSPEQADLDPTRIDTRTDIYSLGVLLYELITGKLPFDSGALRLGGISEMLRILREEKPPQPSRRLSALGESAAPIAERRAATPGLLVRLVRGDLDRITMKAMAKDPEERYASVSELAADLRRYLSSEPILATPPSTLYRLRKLCRRHRRALATAAVVLALILGLAGASAYRNHALAIRRAGELLARGDGHRAEMLSRQRSRQELIERIKETPEALWEPVWEAKRFPLEDQLDARTAEITQLYNEAVGAYREAMQVAPPESEALLAIRRAREAAYWARLQEARYEGAVTVGADFFKRMVETHGLGTYAEELREEIRVQLETEPAGAEVFCFRYEKSEQHLFPIPFSPARGLASVESGLLAEPFLEVERLWFDELWSEQTVAAVPDSSRRPPFLPGDRLLAVNGEHVKRRGELARVLDSVAANKVVRVAVRRGDVDLDVEWIPFPEELYPMVKDPEDRLRPGALVDIAAQLGFTLVGYPLEFRDGCRIGVTEAGSPLGFVLPRGSYLLVIRREGHVDVRLPVASPARRVRQRLLLPRVDDAPEGFVYVPPGPVPYGGDVQAYEPMPRGETEVNGFYMSRLEVTFGDYLEFLNDEETLARIAQTHEEMRRERAERTEKTEEEDANANRDAARSARRLVDWNQDVFKELKPSTDTIVLAPKGMFTRVSNLWTINRKSVMILDSWPVAGVSMLAAAEYALWYTRKKGGGRWRFRLPTTLEWERAARGVDRRYCVWGDRVVWTYCASRAGDWRGRSLPSRVGLYPLDESVFGLRDLAGSVSEPVLHRAPGRRMFVYRGASWNGTDSRDVRIASHNRGRPEETYNDVGIRLVAVRAED